MQLEPRQAQQELLQGKFHPLYMLLGDEVYMIDELLDLIKDKVLGPEGLHDFNLTTYYAHDCDTEAIYDTVQTLPMMAQRRLVILKQADALSSDELDKILPLVENPVESSVFVLMASKVDMRKKFFKNFEKRGAVVRFQRPYENQILPWVHHIAKKLDLSLSNEAAEYIHQSIGINLSSIHNELQKVAQYFNGKSDKLGLDDIKQLITRTRVESVFDFVNCLGNGDAANSLTHLATLLGDGENEIGILTMIIRHYRILILCQEAIKQGLNQSQISGRVGVHGYFLKDYLEQAKQSQPKALKEIYNLLLETDRALKSSPLSSHIWLENLVIQACAIQQSQQHYPSYPSSNQI